MKLNEAERDRLTIYLTAELARARRGRGLLLNVVEATALVADAVCEAARDGKRLGEAVDIARSVLSEREVLPGVVRAVPEVRVEAVFDDGSRLAVVRDPFRAGAATAMAPEPAELPGEVELEVTNTAVVPISVTSHFHFFEANPRLRFDRAAAYGMHLAVTAGAAVRFEPGGTRRVALVPVGGRRVVIGFAGLVDGPLDEPGARARALEKARACGYEDAGTPPAEAE
ncbi:MAG TPA: urease subunit beta [Streptosporangiaceae bacterium]|nr:urease subunit beta [Streptosporangiaceae bacterium]